MKEVSTNNDANVPISQKVHWVSISQKIPALDSVNSYIPKYFIK